MKTETVKRITSSDVCVALKLRYPRQSHALMFEVAPTTGGGTRYADAVAVGLWASHGHAIEGIEVKVSRSDFLAELKQPEKSQPVFQYCDRWWLACPKDMVKPEELPATWGLLELCGDVLRQKVKAPKLTPKPAPIGFLAALLRRYAGMDEDMAEAEVRKRIARAETQYRERLDREFATRSAARVRAAEEGMALIERIQAETGLDLRDWHTKTELLGAVKLALQLERNYDGLDAVRRTAAAMVEAIDASGFLAGGSDGRDTDA